VVGLSILGVAGCLTRPVAKADPQTKVSFGVQVKQHAIDKIDLLLAIDNSASMADKQAILADAVPDLVKRLVTPICVDSVTERPTGQVADTSKPVGSQCAAGTEPEFPPITDIHVGIVSSSLGSFGDALCDDPQQNARANDHGHLLALGKSGQSADAPASFLTWFPSSPQNAGHPVPQAPITDATKLIADFQDIVVGTGQSGCGLEAQLESWYHFLVQPDPWQDIAIDSQNRATYHGVDATILKERHDFLRPDSLLAVIMLTDEDDSFADPLSVQGEGWFYSRTTFPTGEGTPRSNNSRDGTTAPKATAICADNPGDPKCLSCAQLSAADRAKDASCKDGTYYAAADDSLNVRFFDMKRRFGVDPQYPISRYSNGLSRFTVPKGSEEHDKNGSYLVGQGSCTNPIFAAALPADEKGELCKLPKGTRAPENVFFALIGGVPQKLLHADPDSADKSALSEADWVRILGKDRSHFDTSGIDPHMVQSVKPRPGLPAPSTKTGDDGTDPVHGREWETNGNDLQYACTFPLATQKDCSKDSSCDCDGTKNPPLCGSTAKTQTRAKAYPTVRELEVARALGKQGVVASLCPRTLGDLGQELEPDVKSGAPNPLYGYRPAVAAIIDRLKGSLTKQCIPDALVRDDKNMVSCAVLATLGKSGDQSECSRHGLTQPNGDLLTTFLRDNPGSAGHPVCAVPQLAEKPGDTCKNEKATGFCYVENTSTARPAPQCQQAIILSKVTDEALPDATYALQCIQQFAAGEAAGDLSDAGTAHASAVH
jgi:hypothetical protein